MEDGELWNAYADGREDEREEANDEIERLRGKALILMIFMYLVGVLQGVLLNV